MPDLNPTGNPVRIGSILVRTPGLRGTAASHLAGSPGMRSAELSTDALEMSLQQSNIQPQETIEISGAQEIDLPGLQTRSTGYGEPAIELEVPDAGDQWGQFLLSAEESGVTTWNFPRDESDNIDTTRGRAYRTYVIRRHVEAPGEGAQTRGLVGAAGKKILKVLVFPLIDPYLGEVGDYFAAKWEAKKRPYGVRWFTPDNYRVEDPAQLQNEDWNDLSRGPALLMVHGTFSRSHTGFGGLPRETVEQLHRMYGGRVFAFDHFTLSDDPRRNVEWFLEQLPDETQLELDVICHSRGGLVSRTLAEKAAEFSLGSRDLSVRKIVFVAAPNAGTVLTDAKYLGDFIDSYTNILNFFPDIGATEVLDGIITVAKQLAVGAIRGLEGLQAMLPGGSFLKDWLNRGPRGAERYYALASNYEPTEPGFASYARDRLMDKIFQAENDLVVPTMGVYDRNGSEIFPITERHLFSEVDGVHHSNFFSNPTTTTKILEWLR